jgi:hypothetical protein
MHGIGPIRSVGGHVEALKPCRETYGLEEIASRSLSAANGHVVGSIEWPRPAFRGMLIYAAPPSPMGGSWRGIAKPDCQALDSLDDTRTAHNAEVLAQGGGLVSVSGTPSRALARRPDPAPCTLGSRLEGDEARPRAPGQSGDRPLAPRAMAGDVDRARPAAATPNRRGRPARGADVTLWEFRNGPCTERWAVFRDTFLSTRTPTPEGAMTRATMRLRAAAVVIWVLGSGPTLLAQMGVGTWVQQSVGASPGALTMTVEACCNGGRRLVYRAINSPDVMPRGSEGAQRTGSIEQSPRPDTYRIRAAANDVLVMRHRRRPTS